MHTLSLRSINANECIIYHKWSGLIQPARNVDIGPAPLKKKTRYQKTIAWCQGRFCAIWRQFPRATSYRQFFNLLFGMVSTEVNIQFDQTRLTVWWTWKEEERRNQKDTEEVNKGSERRSLATDSSSPSCQWSRQSPLILIYHPNGG